MDYTNLSEITVKSQTELDAIPSDFTGRIYIEFGVPGNRSVVSRRYYRSVVARGNSSVVARGNSSVVARENSSVEARENSSVVAWENSSVEARENSSVVAWENSSVVAWGNSSVVARENSSVVAWENSSVVAWENSSVVAWENSSVVAWENSSVVAWENSSVEANANTQVVEGSYTCKIKISGNARIVYYPKTISEYFDFYGIKHTKTKAILFKAVHKDPDGTYFSDHCCDYTYAIGKKAVAENGLNEDPNEDCGRGIHMAHIGWCLDFGRDWGDLAILEVEAKIDGIILPFGCPGKVRAKEVKVIREVPLSECGVFGKILERRQEK